MKHHEYGPSNYPAWSECPCFRSSHSESLASMEGTDAHAELARALADPEYIPSNYAARWASSLIIEHAEGGEIWSERRVDATFWCLALAGIFGTLDAEWKENNGTLHIADFKTFSDGTIDYLPQLKGYAALSWPHTNLEGADNVKVVLHVLHGGVCKEEIFETTFGKCISDTINILSKVNGGQGKPRLCKWCQYCSKIQTCQQSNNAVQVVSDNAVAFSRLSLCQKLVVLDTVDKLSKTIREEAKAKAVENGGFLDMDGIRYEMKPWAGKSKVRDLCEVAASVASPKYVKVNEKKQTAVEVEFNGLSHEELLKLCDLGKTALANALIEKNPNATKADIKKYVEQFFETTEGTPHFVRVL